MSNRKRNEEKRKRKRVSLISVIFTVFLSVRNIEICVVCLQFIDVLSSYIYFLQVTLCKFSSFLSSQLVILYFSLLEMALFRTFKWHIYLLRATLIFDSSASLSPIRWGPRWKHVLNLRSWHSLRPHSRKHSRVRHSIYSLHLYRCRT